MAYTDDWESLMNGVFGPGGKLKFSQSTPQAAQPKPEKPEKTQKLPILKKPWLLVPPNPRTQPCWPGRKSWMNCSNSRMRP